MPTALTWRKSSMVGPSASRSSTCRICRSVARSAALAPTDNAKNRKKIVIPATAGIHLSAARAAERWVPAFAGTTDLGGRGVILATSGRVFPFYTRRRAGIPVLCSAPTPCAEIGAAFFEEGVGALLRLIGVVIERQRLEGEREDLLAPGLDLGIELFRRDDLVDQPHLEGFGGGVAAAQKPDLARALLAHQARQIGGAPARIDRADARPDLAEHRLFRGDRQVADGRQHVAAADRIALHLGDDRFPAVADR